MLIPASLLQSVLSRPELIHHVAATLLRTRLHITQVPTMRGQRYAGVSQMNVPALVTHAIGALSVFSDVLFSRLLIGASLVGFLCAAGCLAHYVGDACQPLHISRLHHGQPLSVYWEWRAGAMLPPGVYTVHVQLRDVTRQVVTSGTAPASLVIVRHP